MFRPIAETLNEMASGLIDLSLGYLPALETGIHRRRLFAQRYVCVMRTDHPIAGADLTLKLFKTQEHVLTEYSGSGHILLERALTQAGLRDRIKVRLPQYLSAPYFVANSNLLWSVPAILAERLAQHFPLLIKQHPLQLPDFEIALYWHERYHRDPTNKWLRDFIARELQPLGQ
jgi:DNA-binding transcriptional LysR family regulator